MMSDDCEPESEGEETYLLQYNGPKKLDRVIRCC